MRLDCFSLNDSFEVFAHWWLPGAPDNRVPGTLEFSPDNGAILTLQGTFDHPSFDLRHLFSGKGFETERIYGEQPDGQRITALRVFAFEIGSTCSIRCHLVLAGAHVGIDEEKSPTSALFSYDNLEEWASGSVLIPERSQFTSRTTYSYENEPSQLFVLPNNAIDHLLTLTTSVIGRLARNRARFERKAQFSSSFQTSEIKPILKFVSDVGQILTVFMGEAAHLRILRFRIGSEMIDVFFQRARTQSPKKLTSIDMPFPLQDLGPKVGPLFSSWLGSAALMQPVYSAFFSTLFNDASFIDAKFQSLAQAIEGFHRRVFKGKYLEADDYSKIEDSLVRALPAEADTALKDHLKATVKYGNEYSLRRRMKELIDGLEPKTREILGLDTAFTSELVAARNYYAHLDEATRPLCIGNGEALHYLNERLSALFLILILRYLGMAEDEARNGVIKRRRSFK